MSATSSSEICMYSRGEIQILISSIVYPVHCHTASRTRKRARSSATTKAKSKRPPPLTPEESKVLKILEYCELDPQNCVSANDLLLETFRFENCHVRLLVLHIINRLVLRFGSFRKAIAKHFQEVILLGIGKKSSSDLPPPKNIQSIYKERFLEFFGTWYRKYSQDFQCLRTGYQYIRKNRKIAIPNVEAGINKGVQAPKKVVADMSKARRIAFLEEDINLKLGSIGPNLKEIESCFNIINPPIFLDSDSDAEEAASDKKSSALQSPSAPEHPEGGNDTEHDEETNDGEDSEDDWVDAETNLPLSATAWEENQRFFMDAGMGSGNITVSINIDDALREMKNKFKNGDAAVMEILRGNKKLMEKRHYKNVVRWTAELNELLAIGFQDERIVTKLKQLQKRVLITRNRMDAVKLKCTDFGL